MIVSPLSHCLVFCSAYSTRQETWAKPADLPQHEQSRLSGCSSSSGPSPKHIHHDASSTQHWGRTFGPWFSFVRSMVFSGSHGKKRLEISIGARKRWKKEFNILLGVGRWWARSAMTMWTEAYDRVSTNSHRAVSVNSCQWDWKPTSVPEGTAIHEGRSHHHDHAQPTPPPTVNWCLPTCSKPRSRQFVGFVSLAVAKFYAALKLLLLWEPLSTTQD